MRSQLLESYRVKVQWAFIAQMLVIFGLPASSVGGLVYFPCRRKTVF